jgi:hypothetical protein
VKREYTKQAGRFASVHYTYTDYLVEVFSKQAKGDRLQLRSGLALTRVVQTVLEEIRGISVHALQEGRLTAHPLSEIRDAIPESLEGDWHNTRHLAIAVLAVKRDGRFISGDIMEWIRPKSLWFLGGDDLAIALVHMKNRLSSDYDDDRMKELLTGTSEAPGDSSSDQDVTGIVSDPAGGGAMPQDRVDRSIEHVLGLVRERAIEGLEQCLLADEPLGEIRDAIPELLRCDRNTLTQVARDVLAIRPTGIRYRVPAWSSPGNPEVLSGQLLASALGAFHSELSSSVHVDQMAKARGWKRGRAQSEDEPATESEYFVVPSEADCHYDNCPHCGAEIIWIKTPKNRDLALTANTVVEQQPGHWVAKAHTPCSRFAELHPPCKQDTGMHLQLSVMKDKGAIPPYQVDYPFALEIERQWSFDFAWPEIMVALDVDRHSPRPTEFSSCRRQESYHKYNAAALMGWTVLRADAKLASTYALDYVFDALGKRSTPTLRAYAGNGWRVGTYLRRKGTPANDDRDEPGQ